MTSHNVCCEKGLYRVRSVDTPHLVVLVDGITGYTIYTTVLMVFTFLFHSWESCALWLLHCTRCLPEIYSALLESKCIKRMQRKVCLVRAVNDDLHTSHEKKFNQKQFTLSQLCWVGPVNTYSKPYLAKARRSHTVVCDTVKFAFVGWTNNQ